MDDELLEEFLTESAEQLARVDGNLAALERDPSSRATVAAIFRSVHSLKGTSVCLGFSQLAWLAHSCENVLVRLRDGEGLVDAGVAGALIAWVDGAREILTHIRRHGIEGEHDHAHLLDRLEHYAHPRTEHDEETEEALMAAAARAGTRAGMMRSLGSRGDAQSPETSVRVDLRMITEGQRLGRELLAEAERLRAAAQGDQMIANADDRLQTIANAIGRLQTIAFDLSETLRRTRMQQIGALWMSAPRVVRDLARSCGKRVQVDTEGADMEFDRAILEAIKDPLNHLLRNAVDHGIESPEERAALGKPAVGRITLSAGRHNGSAFIAITDDGRGIDIDKVKRLALQRGLTNPDQIDQLTEREAFDLILLPGFSTATKVTHISGRGVGLDVVKTNTQRAGGRVEIKSALGRGTTVRLRFSDTT